MHSRRTAWSTEERRTRDDGPTPDARVPRRLQPGGEPAMGGRQRVHAPAGAPVGAGRPGAPRGGRRRRGAQGTRRRLRSTRMAAAAEPVGRSVGGGAGHGGDGGDGGTGAAHGAERGPSQRL